MTIKDHEIGNLNPGKSGDKTQNFDIDEKFNAFCSGIGNWIGNGLKEFWRMCCHHRYGTSILALGAISFAVSATVRSWHMHLPFASYRDGYPWYIYVATWFLIFFVATTLALGLIASSRTRKYVKYFKGLRLVNGNGETPIFVFKRRLDKYRVLLDFDSNVLGIDQFVAKKNALESCFKQSVESIKPGESPERVRIILSSRKLPTQVNYDEIVPEKKLPKNSFYIGQSMGGVLTQDLFALPHMVIGGATGTGKSIFFKQMLMGLLDSTEYLQLYCVDLKGGIEFRDFKEAPNVKMVSTLEEAATLLEFVKKEMHERYAFLNKAGHRELDPVRDKKDRIIVAVDEASMLLESLPKNHAEHAYSASARRAVDELAKLSRAAGISLILATQKVDKNSIPPQISSNLSGRMAFRVNSVQGSAQIIDTKDAMLLPEISGRGIWDYGATKAVVQAPYADEKKIEEFSKSLKEDFAAERRKLQTSMLDFTMKRDVKNQDNAVQENIE